MIGRHANWDDVIALAELAEATILQRASSFATQWQKGIESGELSGNESFSDPDYVLRWFGGADLLSYAVLSMFADSSDKSEVTCTLGPEGSNAIVAAYALLMFDRSLAAASSNQMAELLSEGADALRYASIDLTRLDASAARQIAQSAAEAELSRARAESARVRWRHLDEYKAKALLEARSMLFTSRAAAAQHAAERLNPKPRAKSRPDEPDEYYPWTKVDEWLKEAGWRAKMTWKEWCAYLAAVDDQARVDQNSRPNDAKEDR